MPVPRSSDCKHACPSSRMVLVILALVSRMSLNILFSLAMSSSAPGERQSMLSETCGCQQTFHILARAMTHCSLSSLVIPTGCSLRGRAPSQFRKPFLTMSFTGSAIGDSNRSVIPGDGGGRNNFSSIRFCVSAVELLRILDITLRNENHLVVVSSHLSCSPALAI